MRLLHILEATQGGTRRHILDLLPGLQKRGFTPELAYSPLRYPAFARDAAKLDTRGIPTWEIPMPHGPHPRDGAALWALAALLKSRKPDLIHCHSTKAGILGRLAARAVCPETPVIYTPHCVAFSTGLPPLQRRAARFLEAILAASTRHFIAVSHHEKRVLSPTICPTSRVSVVPNGVNLAQLDALFAQSTSQSRPLTIGCFGRPSHQKNQAKLLRIWPQIQKIWPGTRLKIVGSGPLETACKQLAHRLHIEPFVEWTGEVFEARPLFMECDIVAQPSLWEGAPYAILEAMAAQRAVVASTVGGGPELLDQSGRLVSTHSDAAWVRALDEVLGDASLRHQLGFLARQRVGEKFSVEQMVSKTAHVYQTALK